ncbi:hypothetical protein [uncultured Roseobacter sp.]|uniref:hypothetical protein n=1 Tax=uncultured Roseobacter sp. TaxID=114847 RepID=UPI00262E150C|nr:hypothetical protein [uncultured Roseobacter sp.]
MQIPDALWRVTAPDAAPAQTLKSDLTLDVAGHKVTAASVIIATNGYSDNLVKGLKRLVLPLYSTQMATEPLSESEIGPILPQGHMISDTRRLIM